MKLPDEFRGKSEWLILGPMGQGPKDESTLPTIAVDGGANEALRWDIWVGDSDSLKKEIKGAYIYKFPSKKNSSDLSLGLSLLQDPLHYKLHLKGFLGGRKDHEWFNLGETLNFLENHSESQASFYNEEGKVVLDLLGAGTWHFSHHGLFSLGSVKKTRISLKGECQYKVRDEFLPPLLSFGLSNVGAGSIHLENDGPVFVYYPEGK